MRRGASLGQAGGGGTKSVVITGGTRGIGFGMAREFLWRGHRVAVCGRDPEGVERAVAALDEGHERGRVVGLVCDVGDYEQVRALWDAAVGRFGEVDVWINNAGVGDTGGDFWEREVGSIEEVVRTNLLGVMNGSKVAMRGMLGQGHGHVYNMEGLGSEGGFVLPGAIVYGATKSGVTYFTRGLVKEAKKTSVRVGFLNPGIVVTDLVSAQDVESSRRFLNAVADRVETVAPYLVRRILANERHGARIEWLSRRKLAWRIVTAPFNKRDPFAKTQA